MRRLASGYADIQSALEELGPPTAGRRRVYRGQSREYLSAQTGTPSITSALARGRSRMYDSGWLSTAVQVLGMGGLRQRQIEQWAVWGPALLQHYGAGSHYVDVTDNISTAVWFATHAFHSRWLSMWVGTQDHVYEHAIPAAWYSMPGPGSVETPRVVYVLDVDPWDGILKPEGGQLVDLVKGGIASWFAQNAARVVAQDGSLLLAEDGFIANGDVGPLVCATFVLAPEFDLSSVPGSERTPSELFPSPERDLCYGIFLRLPARMDFEIFQLTHPLEIPWYLVERPDYWDAHARAGTGDGSRAIPVRYTGAQAGDDPAALKELDGFLKKVFLSRPPIIHQTLVRNSRDDYREKAIFKVDGTTHILRDATVFLLESPVMRFTPDTVGPQAAIWVESGLPLGISDWIDGRSTQSVYLELSGADWFSYIGKEKILRAVWIVRSGLEYGIRLYFKQEEEYPQLTAGFSFDEQQGKFVVNTKVGGSENGASQNNQARRALFCGLAILRDLSPGLKPTMTHVALADDRPVPGMLLTDQRARATLDKSRRYLRICARDGNSYFLMPHDDPRSELNPDEQLAWFLALKRYLPIVKEKFYVAAACRLVAQVYARRGEYMECAEIIEQVRARMGDGAWPPERTVEWDADLAKLLASAYMQLTGRHDEGELLSTMCSEQPAT